MRKRVIGFLAMGMFFVGGGGTGWASSPQVTAGRAALFNNGAPTVSGILSANTNFTAAVQGDASDREAHLFAAVTRLLSSALTKASWSNLTSLGDLIESFGLAKNSNNDLTLGAPYDAPVAIKGQYNPPPTIPSATALTDYLAGPLVTMLDASIADLDAIINASTSANPFALILTATETGDLPVQIDLGDCLTIKAMLLTMKAQALLLHAWNMDSIDIRQLCILDNAGVLQLQRDLLDKYQNFLHLNTGAAATMIQAKAALLAAITTSQAAYDFISTETGDQTYSLFAFTSQEEMNQTKNDLDQLLEVKKSIENNLPVMLGEEEWGWWDATYMQDHQLTIRKDITGQIIGGMTDFGWAIDPTSSTITGNSFTITAKQQTGACTGTWTFSGTTGPSSYGDELSITSFTSTGPGCLANANLTGQNGWISGYDNSEKVDLNVLFGKSGNAPLAIRTYLPSFRADGGVIASTLNADPTMGGFWTDMTQNDFSNSDFDLEVPVATITIDGSEADWNGIASVPMSSGGSGAEPPSSINIQTLSVARDSNYLYWMIKTASSPQGLGMDIKVTINKKATMQANNHLMFANLTQDGTGAVSYQLSKYNSTGTEVVIPTSPSDVNIGNIVEGRVPFSEFAGRAVVEISANMTLSGASSASSYVEDSAALLLPTGTVSGTIQYTPQVTGYNVGQTFIRAYNEADPTTGAFLGSAVVNGVGAYSIPGLPIGGQVYLFALGDTNSNGIKQLSGVDYSGSAGPVTPQASATSQDIPLQWSAAPSETMSLTLAPGWNLMSSKIGFDVPTTMANKTNIITSLWKWQNNSWAVYAPGEWDKGQSYANSKGFAFLDKINPGEGFWVNSQTADPLTLTGVPVYGNLTFNPGWNLVGRKSSIPSPIATFIADKGWAASVWKWENSTWSVALPGEATPGAYAKDKGFGVLNVINPGEGVWVNKVD